MLAETVASWKDTWLAEGIETGRVEGRAEGRVEGRVEGRLSALAESIRALMKNLCISKEKAMDTLSVSEEDRAKLSSVL